jgi:hypothetical protein
VFIYRLVNPTLQIIVLTTTITKDAQNVVLVLPHSELRVSLRTVVRIQIFQACYELTSTHLLPSIVVLVHHQLL